jgi:hypothetical protein
MPISCERKTINGSGVCIADCPVNSKAFLYHRVENAAAIPEPDESIIDIAVLDMNHGWPNLGHGSLVHIVQEAACDLMPSLQQANIVLRVISFDIRRSGVLPEKPGGRFNLYIGTGGPANIDPYKNDGVSPGSQGVQEDPSWEPLAFALFDAIRESEEAAMIGVCHTFGTMCRWSGVAEPVLRSEAKGGKSSGILENILTPQGSSHPWFKHFADRLPERRRLRILDNRFFDLIPKKALHNGILVIGYETLGVGGPQGPALTMLEWKRDHGGVMPRMFAVNHHPEIIDRSRQLLVLEQLHKSGNVTQAWYEERLELLNQSYYDSRNQQLLSLTSDFTLAAPIRYYIFREIRRRAEKLRIKLSVHEDQLIEAMI